MQKYCFYCMNPLNGARFCGRCGNDNNAPTAAAPYHLAPGTVLSGRYVIGRVLGEGGFGITYIGIDTTLSKRVAVKEYYPSEIAGRDSAVSPEVTVPEESESFFSSGVDRFLLEAKSAAAFSDEEGIVDVQDYFQENRTAYIVMDFLDGENLKQYVENHGVMDFERLTALLRPVMKALKDMHAKGMIHRDISPDNIMFTRKGRLKLTDFGSAKRYAVGERQKAIVLKQGYAPEEQYRSDSEQGPFTDVYALCATIYTCITGKVPQPADERLKEDRLESPSQLGADIRPSREKALMRGLAVRAADRTQDMDALMREISGLPSAHGAPKKPKQPAAPGKETKPKQPPASPNEYQNARKDEEDISRLPTKGYKKREKSSKRAFVPVIIAVAVPTVLVAGLIVGLIFFAGSVKSRDSESSGKPSVSESSLDIKELLSGIDTIPSITATQPRTTVPETTAPKSPITLDQAKDHVGELKTFFFDNVINNDPDARYGNTLELRRIYFCESNSDPNAKYVAYVYRNVNSNSYKVMYIPADSFSVEDGELQSSTTTMTACSPANTQSAAAENCWFLSDVYSTRYSKTFIL